jgi:hypothetical protein
LLCVQQSHDYIEKKDSAQGSVISLFWKGLRLTF